VAVALAGSLAGPTVVLAKAPPRLSKEMKRQVVAVVPPRKMHTRGERVASQVHQPMAGFDDETYPAEFGERAAALLSKPPLTWKVTVLDPGEAFYDAVETDDPDDDPATTLTALPADLGEAAYLAVFRYAELAYAVHEQPAETSSGKLEIERSVKLTLDLQLVIYDAATGEPLGTFDAETPVMVPELLPPDPKGMPYYRATGATLRKMARTVAREG